mgnify:CR=1 FL=1
MRIIRSLCLKQRWAVVAARKWKEPIMATLKIKIDAEIVFDDDNKVDDKNFDTIIDTIIDDIKKRS